MKWYDNLYLSENLNGNVKYMKWLVNKGIHLRPLYFVVLSELADGQLEIIPTVTLKLPKVMQSDYAIIGVAKGKHHARSLVATILQDVYDKTGGYDAKSYFKEAFIKQEG